MNSILDQDFNDVEIIVVDDGSKDETAVVIKKFNSVHVTYQYTSNSERGAARNHGLKSAKGSYVNYFDSDDIMLPCLHDLKSFIESRSFPPVVYGDIQDIGKNGQPIALDPQPYRSFTRNLLHNNFLACGSVFLHREVAMLFPFVEDRRLSSAEDWELWLRIHRQHEFVHFPAHVFKQIHHPERSLFSISPERIAARDEYFASLTQADSGFKKFYGEDRAKLFVADRLTFIALCWFNTNRTRSKYYWTLAFKTSILVTKRRRFWALLRKFIFH